MWECEKLLEVTQAPLFTDEANYWQIQGENTGFILSRVLKLYFLIPFPVGQPPFKERTIKSEKFFLCPSIVF